VVRIFPLMLLLGSAVLGCGRNDFPPAAEASAASVVDQVVIPPPAAESSVAQWGFAAPIVHDYSDPNHIVYDDAYLEAYEHRDVVITCGGGTYEIAAPDGPIWVTSGCDEARLGMRFRVEDLLRFLQTRRDNPRFEQVFALRNPEVLQRIRKRWYGRDPWTEDLGMVMLLLGGANYKPAIPLLTALATKDPDELIRVGAVMALGKCARSIPKALKVLVNIYADPVRYKEAATGLMMAGGAAIPTFIQAFDRPDENVRYNAVYSLARMNPEEDVLRAACIALNHRQADVRGAAVMLIQDLQTREFPVATDEVVDGLAKYLSDPAGRNDFRWKATEILGEMKSAAVRARPALLKMSQQVDYTSLHKAAQSALDAIDSAMAECAGR
jgi:HEAT repeat protein